MHRDTILDLWTNYAEELDDLTRAAPDLSFLVDDYKKGVSAIATKHKFYADFEYLPLSWKPGKPDLREIKCYLSPFDEYAPKAYPCLMFAWFPRSAQTKIPERRPFIRMFVWKQGAANLRNAKALAGRLAAAAPHAGFDGAVPSIRGWSGWGRLISEQDYPSGASVRGRSEKAFLKAALRHAERHIATLAKAKSAFRPQR